MATCYVARATRSLLLTSLFVAGCSSSTSDDTVPNDTGAGAGMGASSGTGGTSSSVAGNTNGGQGAIAGSPTGTGAAGTNTGANGGSSGSVGGAGMPGGAPAAGSGGVAMGSGGRGAGGRGAAGRGSGGTPGGAGMTGTAGMGGMTPGLDACPMPPSGTPDASITAINTENTLRLAMGLDCASIALALCTSAQNHCDYYTQNQGTSCEASSPHDEISGCPGFTGVGLGDRFKAAGYTLRGSGSECMAFLDNPTQAVMTFVNSVYHRTPVLDPWMRDFGYGNSTGCDTIDFGTGTKSDTSITAFYPYADETGIPTSFDGSREGPEPPTPPSGWPSGFPVTLYAQNFTADSHTFTLDGDDTPISHQWLAEDDQTLPSYAKVLYADAPLMANTTYHVVITGSVNGAAKTFDWKFTTGAATGGGRPRQ